MLKSYYKQWERNQQIKVAQKAVSHNVHALLRRLWRSSRNVNDVYHDNVIQGAVDDKNISSTSCDGKLLLTRHGTNAIVPVKNTRIVETTQFVPQCRHLIKKHTSQQYTTSSNSKCQDSVHGIQYVKS